MAFQFVGSILYTHLSVFSSWSKLGLGFTNTHSWHYIYSSETVGRSSLNHE